MDITAFELVHQDSWQRLRQLTKKWRLSAAEVDELIDLYESTSAQLSQLLSQSPDPQLTDQLSVLVSRARVRITSEHTSSWRSLVNFFVRDYPGALYSLRWWIIGVTAAFLMFAFGVGGYTANNAGFRNAIIPEAQQKMLAGGMFVQYYYEHSNAAFAASVFTNNAWVAVQSVLFGITGVMVIYALGMNALNVGLSGGVLAAYGGLGTFFGYILPHGLLEMTAIFVAAAAGLRLFWSWVHPGQLTRGASLVLHTRRMMTVALGLVPTLLLAGLLEGFITPAVWLPQWGKIVIGALVWLGFIAYIFFPGRAAVHAGYSGDWDAEEHGNDLAMVAK